MVTSHAGPTLQDAPLGQEPSASKAEGVFVAHSAGQMGIQVPLHHHIPEET